MVICAAVMVCGRTEAQFVSVRPLPLPPTHVVATGDSHTVRYTRHGRFASALAERSTFWRPYTSDSFAVPGTDAAEYGGLVPNPQVTDELVDYTAETLALDPDIVVWMLGTNDAFLGDQGFAAYQSLVPGFWRRYQAAGVTLIVGNPPPVLPLDDRLAAVERRLVEDYQPQLFGMAEDFDLPVVDLRQLITAQPDWQSLYAADGYHLTDAGYTLVAGWFADEVVRQTNIRRLRPVAVPEPPALLLCAGALLMPRRVRHG